MATGKKPASSAGRILSSRKSTRTQRRVAASDLAQRPSRRSSKRK